MKAMIAMSGGVDSSVAAWLMQRQGCDCLGVTLRLYRSGAETGSRFPACCSEQDVQDAAEVAFQLGMPHGVLDYTEDFSRLVMDKFARVYAAGGTPNPCIDCNRYLKFERLLSAARSMGCETLVTGHYARVERDGDSGRWLLKKALDPGKDQSYVLYMLSQDKLSHLRFPLGELSKAQVRAIAEEQSFVNARKHDSQDLCFVPDRDYAAFLQRYTGRFWPEGPFVDEQGRVLGRHRGIIHYTIGQRRGLGISADRPWYVSRIDPEANTVTLTHGDGLFARTVIAGDINLIAEPALQGERRVMARLRYRQAEQPATVRQEGDRLICRFDEPQRAPTPGQALVLYEAETVLGGGTITEVLP